MRGSMVSCSLCNRKSHMFAVRISKYTCLQIAAENRAVLVLSGHECSIGDIPIRTALAVIISNQRAITLIER